MRSGRVDEVGRGREGLLTLSVLQIQAPARGGEVYARVPLRGEFVLNRLRLRGHRCTRSPRRVVSAVGLHVQERGGGTSAALCGQKTAGPFAREAGKKSLFGWGGCF